MTCHGLLTGTPNSNVRSLVSAQSLPAHSQSSIYELSIARIEWLAAVQAVSIYLSAKYNTIGGHPVPGSENVRWEDFESLDQEDILSIAETVFEWISDGQYSGELDRSLELEPNFEIIVPRLVEIISESEISGRARTMRERLRANAEADARPINLQRDIFAPGPRWNQFTSEYRGQLIDELRQESRNLVHYLTNLNAQPQLDRQTLIDRLGHQSWIVR